MSDWTKHRGFRDSLAVLEKRTLNVILLSLGLIACAPSSDTRDMTAQGRATAPNASDTADMPDGTERDGGRSVEPPKTDVSDASMGGADADGTTETSPTDQTDLDANVSPPGPVAFAQNFDDLEAGDSWLRSCKWNKHVVVAKECGVEGSSCLRVTHDPERREPSLFPLPPVDERPPYPADAHGVCEPYYTNTATDVIQQVQPIPAGDEYSLNYDVFFEQGYDWARGGKLPGLSGTDWDSGCSIEGDGLSTDPGKERWSVRLMWRAGGSNELYVYDQDRVPGACGDRGPTSIPFTTGKWQAVTLYVRLNSEGESSDGEARYYLDGQLLRRETGLRLRAKVTDDSRIRNIFFSTFFGGNESKRLYCLSRPGEKPYCVTPDPYASTTWVPSHASIVRFDNLSLFPGLHVRRDPGKD